MHLEARAPYELTIMSPPSLSDASQRSRRLTDNDSHVSPVREFSGDKSVLCTWRHDTGIGDLKAWSVVWRLCRILMCAGLLAHGLNICPLR